MTRPGHAVRAPRPAPVRFERCDPERTPAAGLLAAMRAELNDVYDAADRLDTPPLEPEELRPPHGAYLVAFEGADPVAGGGVRRLGDGVGEIKRMYVLPDRRSRGLAALLLAALEDAARSLGHTRVRLDTGPRQEHALRLYRSAGYAEVAPYNDNPYAAFWGEKRLV